MSRLSFFLLIFFILGSVVFLWATFFFHPSENQTQINIPIPIYAKSVGFAGITYAFSGQIKNANVDENTAEITLVHMEPGIEKFSFCVKCLNKAQVNYKWNNLVTRTNPYNLKPNQKVEITTTYNLKKKFWNTHLITIFAPPSSSSSSALKP